MKKTKILIDLGEYMCYGNYRSITVTITIEEDKDNRKIISFYGNIGNFSSGQNQDDIEKYVTRDMDKLKNLISAWNEYHLNDCKSACKHQEEKKLYLKKLEINTYKLRGRYVNYQKDLLGYVRIMATKLRKSKTDKKDIEVIYLDDLEHKKHLQSKLHKYYKDYKCSWGDYDLYIEQPIRKKKIEIEDMLINEAISSKNYHLTKEEKEILRLKYTVIGIERSNRVINKYYKLDKTETKASGYVSEKQHKEGYLTKKCPICGYKYGTKHLYKEVPEEIIADMINGFGLKIIERKTT